MWSSIVSFILSGNLGKLLDYVAAFFKIFQLSDQQRSDKIKQEVLNEVENIANGGRPKWD